MFLIIAHEFVCIFSQAYYRFFLGFCNGLGNLHSIAMSIFELANRLILLFRATGAFRFACVAYSTASSLKNFTSENAILNPKSLSILRPLQSLLVIQRQSPLCLPLI